MPLQKRFQNLSLVDFANLVTDTDDNVPKDVLKYYRDKYFPFTYHYSRTHLHQYVIDKDRSIYTNNPTIKQVYQLLLSGFGNIKQCCEHVHMSPSTFTNLKCTYTKTDYHDIATQQLLHGDSVTDIQKQASQLGIELPNSGYLYHALGSDGVCKINDKIVGHLTKIYYLKSIKPFTPSTNQVKLDYDHVIDTKNDKLPRIYGLLLCGYGGIKQCRERVGMSKRTFSEHHCCYYRYYYHDMATDKHIEAATTIELREIGLKSGLNMPSVKAMYKSINHGGIVERRHEMVGQISKTLFLKRINNHQSIEYTHFKIDDTDVIHTFNFEQKAQIYGLIMSNTKLNDVNEIFFKNKYSQPLQFAYRDFATNQVVTDSRLNNLPKLGQQMGIDMPNYQQMADALHKKHNTGVIVINCNHKKKTIGQITKTLILKKLIMKIDR